MNITKITPDSPFLEDVLLLHNKSKRYLGFLSKGAFVEYAYKNTLDGVINEDNQCVGYLLFRVTRNRISITHLCIAKDWRGNGLAKHLFSNLINKTIDFDGIGLYCRQDFPASNLWPKLGFIPISEKTGRGYDQAPLTYWWYSHGHPDLFTYNKVPGQDTKLLVAIDTNILLSLENKDDQVDQEIRALHSDWLINEIKLCVTPAIFLDFNRIENKEKRKERREVLRKYQQIRGKPSEVQPIMEKLGSIFTEVNSEQDRTDLKHIAYSKAAGVDAFLTKDRAIYEKSDAIYDAIGVNVFRPSEFITRTHEIQQEHLYSPKRLNGTLLKVNSVNFKEANLNLYFQASSQRERKKQFLNKFSYYQSKPNIYRSQIVKDQSKRPLSLVVYGREDKNILSIELMRVVKTSFAPTLAINLVCQSLWTAIREGKVLVIMKDSFVQPEVIQALRLFNFLKTNNFYSRLVVRGFASKADLYTLLSNMSCMLNRYKYPVSQLKDYLSYSIEAPINLNFDRKLEEDLWPLKIKDYDLPCYIVPIQPRWAIDLFDTGLADSNLFGSDPDLSFNIENVYYKSTRHGGLKTAPARVIWYISKANEYPESMSLRACSYVTHIEFDTPKKLYNRYKRLGVYQFKQVVELAKGDYSKKIMAICFGRTEQFNSPIDWSTIQQALKKYDGKKNQIQNPIRISRDLFEYFYNKGVA